MIGPPQPPSPDDDLGALYSNAGDEQGDHPPEVGDEQNDHLGDAAPDAGDDHDDHQAELDDEHDDDSSGGGGDLFAGLTHKQSLGIMALMSESSLERAAQRSGTSVRSLTRWMHQPTFQRAYRQARRQAFNQAIGLVVKYAPLAVSTLVQTMADANAPHHAKVSAATAVLKYGREGIELDDIAARLEAIEASLNIQAPKGRLAPSTNGWRN